MLNLAGMQQDGGNMFGSFNSDYGIEQPTAADMEKSEEAIRFKKTVKVKDIRVETYDLSDPKQVAKYRKDRKHIMDGLIAKKLAVMFSDKRFVESIPGYMAHMEWVEYELNVKELNEVSK